MNGTMFNDHSTATTMNIDKNRSDYRSRCTEPDKICSNSWSPIEESKSALKHRYVSCSRSVPRRNKRFVLCKISRSLNFNSYARSSSSENSSFEEEKHLSRSAKIMRALNFNSSASYYGKTKIKRSLNFNLTPSPKRFLPVKKSIRKTLSLNFSSPLSLSNKVLDFDENAGDTINSSLTFTSSESIDENQNETPSRQSTKEHDTLHYSTPNAKLDRKSVPLSADYTPVLRSRLKKNIDNIIYIAASPNSQDVKYIKGRTKYIDDGATNTSRNLFYEFHDKDDGRPCTPENVIHIMPESMSAIKRSHKKERSSRRSERSVTDLSDTFVAESVVTGRESHQRTDSLQGFSSMDRYHSGHSDMKNGPTCSSENDISDTGSLFDYTEEQEDVFQKYRETVNRVPNIDCNLSEPHEYDIKVKPEESLENVCEIQAFSQDDSLEDLDDVVGTDDFFLQTADVETDVRSVTPEPMVASVLESQKTVTPENRINFLERIARDSIKKSHKKNKDDNKKKLFSPKILQCKFEIAEPEHVKRRQSLEEGENIEDNELAVEHENSNDKLRLERACTPEKLNSSRLLLSQYSSVKKSHKKDKYNKILSGFLKRQEYFNKELDSIGKTKKEEFNIDDATEREHSVEELSTDFDADADLDVDERNTSPDKLSPNKREKLLNTSLSDHDTSASSDLQECDLSKEDFKIFTPLKRKRSLIASKVKEHTQFYDLPSGKDEISEEETADISASRCLTPVTSFNFGIVKPDGEISTENLEMHVCEPVDGNGRSTPRNMSTAELYSNLDSIKKSHKKNKRGISTRNELHLVRSKTCGEEQRESSSEDIEKEEMGDMTEFLDDSTERMNADAPSTSDRLTDQLAYELESTEDALPNVTPPNCLKAKNYMRLLRETSIKRSHKKVRDLKKIEYMHDANELSDDGSIFGGDDEKLPSNENRSVLD